MTTYMEVGSLCYEAQIFVDMNFTKAVKSRCKILSVVLCGIYPH